MQIRRVTAEFWLAPPSLHTVLDAFIDFISFNFPRPELVILYMIAIVLLAFILPQKRWQLGLTTAWLVVRDIETADPDWRVKDWWDNNGYERQEDFVRDELTVLTYIRWDLASVDG